MYISTGLFIISFYDDTCNTFVLIALFFSDSTKSVKVAEGRTCRKLSELQYINYLVIISFSPDKSLRHSSRLLHVL